MPVRRLCRRCANGAGGSIVPASTTSPARRSSICPARRVSAESRSPSCQPGCRATHRRAPPCRAAAARDPPPSARVGPAPAGRLRRSTSLRLGRRVRSAARADHAGAPACASAPTPRATGRRLAATWPRSVNGDAGERDANAAMHRGRDLQVHAVGRHRVQMPAQSSRPTRRAQAAPGAAAGWPCGSRRAGPTPRRPAPPDRVAPPARPPGRGAHSRIEVELAEPHRGGAGLQAGRNRTACGRRPAARPPDRPPSRRASAPCAAAPRTAPARPPARATAAVTGAQRAFELERDAGHRGRAEPGAARRPPDACPPSARDAGGTIRRASEAKSPSGSGLKPEVVVDRQRDRHGASRVPGGRQVVIVDRQSEARVHAGAIRRHDAGDVALRRLERARRQSGAPGAPRDRRRAPR